MSNATAVRERPIIMTGESVRATLAGLKTQTRRVVKNPDWFACLTGDCPHQMQAECDASLRMECPYGVVGDRLWVKETFGTPAFEQGDDALVWRADLAVAEVGYDSTFCMLDWKWIIDPTRAYPEPRWRSPIHMPRWASRITLEITDVRVERLQDITWEDAKAEGMRELDDENRAEWSHCAPPGETTWPTLQEYFAGQWDRLNARRGHPWSNNPWVRALTFRMLP